MILEDAMDWYIMRMIAPDADAKLGGLLDGLMDEEPMWEEFVVPELDEYFSGQLRTVVEAVARAKGGAKDGAGEIFIPKDEVETWYGALNQARLCLEEKYQLHETEREDWEKWEEEKRGAMIRSHGYQAIQQELLGMMM